MKQNLKYIIVIALIVIVVVTFHIVRRNATMRGIESTVVTDGHYTLLSSSDVDSLILAAFPGLLSSDIKDVPKHDIAKVLKSHPYILNASTSLSTGGKLLVEVEQRSPVVRLFFQNNEFYLSREGTVMPLCPKHYCHVLVGSSGLSEPKLQQVSKFSITDTAIHYKPESIMKIWKLSTFLYDNPKYGDIFDQVYVNEKGDLILVPKLSDLTINVGDTSHFETKFENLWAFFDKGINQVGWDAYSAISLKYNDQVVCTKRTRR